MDNLNRFNVDQEFRSECFKEALLNIEYFPCNTPETFRALVQGMYDLGEVIDPRAEYYYFRENDLIAAISGNKASSLSEDEKGDLAYEGFGRLRDLAVINGYEGLPDLYRDQGDLQDGIHDVDLGGERVTFVSGDVLRTAGVFVISQKDKWAERIQRDGEQHSR